MATPSAIIAVPLTRYRMVTEVAKSIMAVRMYDSRVRSFAIAVRSTASGSPAGLQLFLFVPFVMLSRK